MPLACYKEQKIGSLRFSAEFNESFKLFVFRAEALLILNRQFADGLLKTPFAFLEFAEQPLGISRSQAAFGVQLGQDVVPPGQVELPEQINNLALS
jgi:hypothetical protein